MLKIYCMWVNRKEENKINVKIGAQRPRDLRKNERTSKKISVNRLKRVLHNLMKEKHISNLQMETDL